MTETERTFVKEVWAYYQQHGRHTLPWRQTTDPYHILVSEVMLQQTQVERVLPKYEAFISAYPTVTHLAAAPLKDVLKLWQGLGYNRRAQALQRAACYVRSDLRGIFPTTYEGLLALPGVGPYTAGAIMAFAYNQSVPIIETNIRTVYLYHFFPKQSSVSEAALMEKIVATLDTSSPRTWYAALMDYGVYLKRTHGNQNTRAAGHVTQSTFVGSDRQIRGAIVRVLTAATAPMSRRALTKQLAAYDPVRVDVQLEKLQAEGLVERQRARYTLPT